MAIKLRIAEHKSRFLVLSVLVMLVVALFYPIVYNQVVGLVTDYGSHIELAQKMANDGGRIESPHFLFQWLLIGAHILIPNADYPTLGILTGVACYVFLGLVLYGLIRPALGDLASYRVEAMSIACVLVLMLVTPIFLLVSWLDHHFYFGYLYSGNVYHNPTILIIKPLSVLLDLMAVKIFVRQGGRASAVQILVSGLLTLVSAIAKPSYLICLLPALVIFTILRFYRKESLDWKLLLLGFVLPLVAILLWQYNLTYTSSAITVTQAKIIFAPFVVLSHASSWLFLKFLVSILFPLCVYFAYFKKSVQDVGLNFAWLVFLIGAAYTYLLAEDGDRLFAGNFAWSGQITSFVLFVISVRFFIPQEAGRVLGKLLDKPGKRFWGCVAVLGAHLISGMVWYFAHSPFSSIDPITWW